MLKTTLISLCGCLALAAGCGSKGGDPAQCSAAAEKGVAAMQEAVKSNAASKGATPDQVAQITDGIGKLKDVALEALHRVLERDKPDDAQAASELESLEQRLAGG